MTSSIEDRLSAIQKIKEGVDNSTIFQLLWYIEKLTDTALKAKEKLRSIKDLRSLMEAEITININLDDSVKATNKKSSIDLAKSSNSEYSRLNTEYNDLKYLIEVIEDLIKIITLKYKLVEPAFHAHGVLTYKQLESEFKNR